MVHCILSRQHHQETATKILYTALLGILFISNSDQGYSSYLIAVDNVSHAIENDQERQDQWS